MFARIWQYRVRADRLAEFRAEYGTAGGWVALFRGAPGYLGTELLEAVTDPAVFVTIDRWVSSDAWQTFLQANEQAYRALDRACERLTEDERELGSFQDPAT
jgi:heme-degrading monooxygenase HmoA